MYSADMESMAGTDLPPDERHLSTLATALARAVDAKDSYTRSHCETVAELCVLIAGELGLDTERWRGSGSPASSTTSARSGSRTRSSRSPPRSPPRRRRSCGPTPTSGAHRLGGRALRGGRVDPPPSRAPRRPRLPRRPRRRRRPARVAHHHGGGRLRGDDLRPARTVRGARSTRRSPSSSATRGRSSTRSASPRCAGSCCRSATPGRARALGRGLSLSRRPPAGPAASYQSPADSSRCGGRREARSARRRFRPRSRSSTVPDPRTAASRRRRRSRDGPRRARASAGRRRASISSRSRGAGRERRRAAMRAPAARRSGRRSTSRSGPVDAIADGAAQTPALVHLGHPVRVERQAARRSTARRRFIASSAATL